MRSLFLERIYLCFKTSLFPIEKLTKFSVLISTCSPLAKKYSCGAAFVSTGQIKTRVNTLTAMAKEVINERSESITNLIFKEFNMSSNTTQTRIRRKLKRKKAGAKRKNANENKGTTPKFAIHPENK